MNLKRLRFNLIHKDAVDSTNNYAANLIKKTKVVNGTVILTKRQFAGKGQRGENWFSEENQNLTFSVVVDTQVHVNRVFYLNIVAALSIRKLLSDLNIDAQIKWPNDILVNHKKIAGVLIENQLQQTNVRNSIIGIGLNVNQSDFDSSLQATSIRLEKLQDIEPFEVFLQLYSYLDFYTDLLMQQQYDLLLKHYYTHLLWYNEYGEFRVGEELFDAKNLGIDTYGRLKLQTNSGIKLFDVKEVKFVL